MNKLAKIGLLTALIAVFVANMAAAEIITLKSGNGVIDTLDPLITCVAVDNDAFTATDFANARNGVHATIVKDYVSNFVEVPGTHWITNNGWSDPVINSVLYAQTFTVTEAFNSATMNFTFSIDDYLGTATVPGLYINGQAIIPAADKQGSWKAPTAILNIDITPYLVVGQNVLYTFQYDTGYAAGTSYLAEITTVPEPATMALLALGGLALRRRKK